MVSGKSVRGSDAGSLHRDSTDVEPVWGVIILAAGASVRMGQPKMLLACKRTTVLGRVIALARQFRRARIAVVIAADDERIRAELRRLRIPSNRWIINPQPSRGMFSSIQCAASWNGWNDGLTHWAIMLGDQPQLQPGTIRQLAEFAARHPADICQPSRSGRARHPVVLPASGFRELARTTHETLRHFLEAKASAVRLIEIDDAGLEIDLDTPQDYQKFQDAIK